MTNIPEPTRPIGAVAACIEQCVMKHGCGDCWHKNDINCQDLLMQEALWYLQSMNGSAPEGWISITEQKPVKMGSYLVFCQYRHGNTRQDIKLWMPNLNRFTSEANAVKYWRPLPPDPEVVND